MKKFLDEDFILQTETAKILFHNYAKDMPIIDYHNHLSPKEIYEDKKFSSITEAWLGFDHYKWRALRTNGVQEKYITGKDTSPKEKFDKWAETVPYLMGNPLYHWTHLELQRYFGINDILSPETADSIYQKANGLLEKKEFSARNLIRKMNLHTLCTTDDPKDDLKYHLLLREEGYEVNVLPSFRPDKAIYIEKPEFPQYVEDLGQVVSCKITSYADLVKALVERLDFFVKAGCKVTDHGLERIQYLPSTLEEVEAIFEKGLKGCDLTEDELRKYKGRLLSDLGREYSKRNLVFQIHIGPMRNNSTRRLREVGVDSGFDSMDDGNVARDLSRLLDSLDITNQLPKTILYCLNPKDNEVLSSMCPNFQDGETRGKIQFGTAWWFNDQKDGMERQMEQLAQMGMISRFVGMLTDSRSFLSFPRHEYFRRILCNKLGNLIENGEYPADIQFVGKVVQDICFNNIKEYMDL